MLKQLIKTRLYASTPKEIVQYSKKYGIEVTANEAQQLLSYIRNEKIDPFSKTDRSKTFNYIEKTIGKKEAQKADQLLQTLAKKYNLDHYL
ncbi:DUF2624 family protein [Bacillaceae bacterium W0354]